MAQQRHRRLLPSVLASRLALGGLVAIAGGLGGCFDSDEVFRVAATTGDVDPSTSSSSTTEMESSSSSDDSSTGEPPVTCRQAVQCIQGCAFMIGLAMEPEPDLSCFLECEEGLTVREAYHLLNLANCAAEDCQMSMDCSDGMGSSSSSSGTSDGGEAGGPPPLIDPCLGCIFGLMLDENAAVCSEFHALCD